MKLATLKSNDTRDGVLYVVNKSLTKAIAASQIALTCNLHWIIGKA